MLNHKATELLFLFHEDVSSLIFEMTGETSSVLSCREGDISGIDNIPSSCHIYAKAVSLYVPHMFRSSIKRVTKR